MSGLPEAIIIDLDDTLMHVDREFSKSCIEPDGFNFQKYAVGMLDFETNRKVMNLILAQDARGARVIILTARSEEIEEACVQDLNNRWVPFDKLLMMPLSLQEGWTEETYKDLQLDYKVKCLDELQKEYKVVLVADDLLAFGQVCVGRGISVYVPEVVV